jgi:hypothetical protein
MGVWLRSGCSSPNLLRGCDYFLDDSLGQFFGGLILFQDDANAQPWFELEAGGEGHH